MSFHTGRKKNISFIKGNNIRAKVNSRMLLPKHNPKITLTSLRRGWVGGGDDCKRFVKTSERYKAVPCRPYHLGQGSENFFFSFWNHQMVKYFRLLAIWLLQQHLIVIVWKADTDNTKMNECGCALIKLYTKNRWQAKFSPQVKFANPELDKKVSKFHKGIPSRLHLINQKTFKNPKVSQYHLSFHIRERPVSQKCQGVPRVQVPVLFTYT